MGVHRGTDSLGTGNAVRARQVTDALEDWTYSTRPTDADAVTRRLATALPDATVQRGDSSDAADVIVDDVAVLIAHTLDLRLRRDVFALAERVDELVVYSTSCHTATPGTWQTFKHRCRNGVAGASVRFVHRPVSDDADESRPGRALATIALSLVAIGGLLGGSLGLFAGGSPTWEFGIGVAAGLAALVVAGVVVLATLRPRVSTALLRRIPHA